MAHGFSVHWPGCPAAPAVARTATASRIPTTAVAVSGIVYGPWKPDMAACGADATPISNVTKPAKMETGLVVPVPPFINEGEVIRVSTADGSYLERA